MPALTCNPLNDRHAGEWRHVPGNKQDLTCQFCVMRGSHRSMAALRFASWRMPKQGCSRLRKVLAEKGRSHQASPVAVPATCTTVRAWQGSTAPRKASEAQKAIRTPN